MQNKALVVIDIQNDITKNYKEIIGHINLRYYASKGCKVENLSI